MTQARITATAYIGDEPMKRREEIISWTTETSTDLPSDALGEAVGICLQRAWMQGIDPPLTSGFHVRVTFS